MKDSPVQMSVNKQLVALREKHHDLYDIPHERFPERPPWLVCEHTGLILDFIRFCTLKFIKIITIIFSIFHADLSV